MTDTPQTKASLKKASTIAATVKEAETLKLGAPDSGSKRKAAVNAKDAIAAEQERKRSLKEKLKAKKAATSNGKKHPSPPTDDIGPAEDEESEVEHENEAEPKENDDAEQSGDTENAEPEEHTEEEEIEAEADPEAAAEEGSDEAPEGEEADGDEADGDEADGDENDQVAEEETAEGEVADEEEDEEVEDDADNGEDDGDNGEEAEDDEETLDDEEINDEDAPVEKPKPKKLVRSGTMAATVKEASSRNFGSDSSKKRGAAEAAAAALVSAPKKRKAAVAAPAPAKKSKLLKSRTMTETVKEAKARGFSADSKKKRSAAVEAAAALDSSAKKTKKRDAPEVNDGPAKKAKLAKGRTMIATLAEAESRGLTANSSAKRPAATAAAEAIAKPAAKGKKVPPTPLKSPAKLMKSKTMTATIKEAKEMGLKANTNKPRAAAVASGLSGSSSQKKKGKK
ncbi:hypothetical protein HDU84_007773 [Entophlyctis sp. JEL0112]|nr:hypothetical protein HDU84_007773 [Entophlyctis sp. JEL0112]